MKYTFLILILSSFTLYLISCEKAEVQKEDSSSAKIHPRGGCVDECDDCDPVEDCCCSIELLTDPGAGGLFLELCGTSSPCLSSVTCAAENVGICADISGFIEDFYFPVQSTKLGFCVPKNASFGIVSATPGAHTVRITCQEGQTSPQSVTITLNTPPDKPYWETNGDCELTECF